MNKHYRIENDNLIIAVNQIGAELSSIRSKINNREYLWQGDKKPFWNEQSPILFPNIGSLKNDRYLFNGKSYHLNKHGFIRGNADIKLANSEKDSLSFSLCSSEQTLKQYPFYFQFIATFQLKENFITTTYHVLNTGNQILYFSVGGHPGFNCSLINSNDSFDNCFITFQENEKANTSLISSEGLILNQKKLILDGDNKLMLTKNIFDNDALVFENLKSHSLTIHNKKEGKLVSVSFNEYPFLGIWSQFNAPFICIEPWLGIPDLIDSNQQLSDKSGITALEKSEEYKISFTIEIHQ